jgi:WD40 repeat protein
MTEAEQPPIQIIMASQTFEGHEDSVFAAIVFPDRHCMVTALGDKTLCLWDLEDGVVLKIMEGHHHAVYKIAISTDMQFIASGDKDRKLIAWNKDGESLTQPIEVHSNYIYMLNFSPASTELASSSFDTTAVLWNTETWEVHRDLINCGPGAEVHCLRYSLSGEHIAITTKTNIQI